MLTKGRLIWLVLTLLLVALAFAAGRFAAAAPTFVAATDAGGEELQSAFDEFQRAQRETLALMQQRELSKVFVLWI